jgi:hypothetical protein
MRLPGDSTIPVAGKLQADITDPGDQGILRRGLLMLVVIASPGQVHQFAPPLNAFDKGAILGNELSLFSVFFRLLCTAFLKTRSPG